MSSQKYSLIEILIVTFSLFMFILIVIFQAIVRIFKPGYSIWFDWIDHE